MAIVNGYNPPSEWKAALEKLLNFPFQFGRLKINTKITAASAASRKNYARFSPFVNSLDAWAALIGDDRAAWTGNPKNLSALNYGRYIENNNWRKIYGMPPTMRPDALGVPSLHIHKENQNDDLVFTATINLGDGITQSVPNRHGRRVWASRDLSDVWGCSYTIKFFTACADVASDFLITGVASVSRKENDAIETARGLPSFSDVAGKEINLEPYANFYRYDAAKTFVCAVVEITIHGFAGDLFAAIWDTVLLAGGNLMFNYDILPNGRDANEIVGAQGITQKGRFALASGAPADRVEKNFFPLFWRSRPGDVENVRTDALDFNRLLAIMKTDKLLFKTSHLSIFSLSADRFLSVDSSPSFTTVKCDRWSFAV